MIVSPGAKAVASGPQRSTVPDRSKPRVNGIRPIVATRIPPRRSPRSVPLMLDAAVLTRISSPERRSRVGDLVHLQDVRAAVRCMRTALNPWLRGTACRNGERRSQVPAGPSQGDPDDGPARATMAAATSALLTAAARRPGARSVSSHEPVPGESTSRGGRTSVQDRRLPARTSCSPCLSSTRSRAKVRVRDDTKRAPGPLTSPGRVTPAPETVTTRVAPPSPAARTTWGRLARPTSGPEPFVTPTHQSTACAPASAAVTWASSLTSATTTLTPAGTSSSRRATATTS
jgi:hypothetical protein